MSKHHQRQSGAEIVDGKIAAARVFRPGEIRAQRSERYHAGLNSDGVLPDSSSNLHIT
jgi:hypothetical protein